MQVAPDWSRKYTPAQAEAQLKDFKFKGPGLYMTKTDTMIVVRVEPIPYGTSPWKHAHRPDELFEFHVYNCPFEETIFGADRLLVTRQDDR